MTLTGWTDAAIAITLSGSIKSSINASETHGNKKYISNIIIPYVLTVCVEV